MLIQLKSLFCFVSVKEIKTEIRQTDQDTIMTFYQNIRTNCHKYQFGNSDLKLNNFIIVSFTSINDYN